MELSNRSFIAILNDRRNTSVTYPVFVGFVIGIIGVRTAMEKGTSLFLPVEVIRTMVAMGILGCMVVLLITLSASILTGRFDDVRGRVRNNLMTLGIVTLCSLATAQAVLAIVSVTDIQEWDGLISAITWAGTVLLIATLGAQKYPLTVIPAGGTLALSNIRSEVRGLLKSRRSLDILDVALIALATLLFCVILSIPFVVSLAFSYAVHLVHGPELFGANSFWKVWWVGVVIGIGLIVWVVSAFALNAEHEQVEREQEGDLESTE